MRSGKKPRNVLEELSDIYRKDREIQRELSRKQRQTEQPSKTRPTEQPSKTGMKTRMRPKKRSLSEEGEYIPYEYEYMHPMATGEALIGAMHPQQHIYAQGGYSPLQARPRANLYEHGTGMSKLEPKLLNRNRLINGNKLEPRLSSSTENRLSFDVKRENILRMRQEPIGKYKQKSVQKQKMMQEQRMEYKMEMDIFRGKEPTPTRYVAPPPTLPPPSSLTSTRKKKKVQTSLSKKLSYAPSLVGIVKGVTVRSIPKTSTGLGVRGIYKGGNKMPKRRKKSRKTRRKR